ncbi:MAG: hypothetical protein MK095_09705, partial [Phycisphaerales bacterium]|nr:hypothetical protein [Phycisphaerales bacterium]
GPMGGGGHEGGGSRSGSGRRSNRSESLDTMAPLPVPPALYPPNTTRYDVPLTFEIELLDPKAAPKTAASNGQGGGA